jgi:hypothetical protein
MDLACLAALVFALLLVWGVSKFFKAIDEAVKSCVYDQEELAEDGHEEFPRERRYRE